MGSSADKARRTGTLRLAWAGLPLFALACASWIGAANACAQESPPAAKPETDATSTSNDPSKALPGHDASDEKTPPKKKKGAAGRIAEQQAAEKEPKTPGKLEPRNADIAWIEFGESIDWPISAAENGAEKLLYAFKLTDPKDKKKKATLTVSFMPERKGKTTTVLKNWCESFLLKGGGRPSVGELAKDEEVNGLKLTTLEVQGALKQSKQDKVVTGQKLIGAVVHHPQGPFFIRAEGPLELIEPHRDAILKFIHSVRPAEKPPVKHEADAGNPATKAGAAEEGAQAKPPEAKPVAADPQKPGQDERPGGSPPEP